MPRRIGIATSLQAAALQDMLNVLRRRFPLVEVLVSACLVQGERAPDSIVTALYDLFEADVDLIILARGGGAADDLWAFNDEAVVRAVFASPVPLITGVGHETDTTLVDDVADLRAPTPSAAAELAAPERSVLAAQVADLRIRAALALADTIAAQRSTIADYARRLARLAPTSRLSRDRQLVDEFSRRLQQTLIRRLMLQRSELSGLHARLATLSPRATLARGYAVVRDEEGRVLTGPDQVSADARLHITLRDGELHAIPQPAPDSDTSGAEN